MLENKCSPGPNPDLWNQNAVEEGWGKVQESAYQQPAPEVLMGTAAPGNETMSVPKPCRPQMTGRDGVVGLGVEREGSMAP